MNSWVGSVLFVVGLTVAIALHEWGHLITAKRYGMRAKRYFIGFGPTIWSFRRGETEYGLKWLLFGGFVQIAGMSTADERQSPVADTIFDREAVTNDRRAELDAGGTGMDDRGPDPGPDPGGHIPRREPADPEGTLVVPERTWRRLDEELDRRGVAARDRQWMVDETRRRMDRPASAADARRTFAAVAGERLTDTEDVSDLHHRVLRGDDGRFFHDRPAWQRAVVLSAGSAMHFLIAFLLLFIGFWLFNTQQLPIVENVVAESPAASAGLQAGDRIVAVDDQPVDSFADARSLISGQPGQPVTLSVSRDSQTRDIQLRTALTVGALTQDSPLAAAGLRPGDRIVTVDGVPVADIADIRQAEGTGPTEITVRRSGPRTATTAQTETVEIPAGSIDELADTIRGLAGFVPAEGGYGVVEAVEATFVGPGSFPDLVVRTVRGVGQLFGPNGLGAIPEQLSGEAERDLGDATPVSVVGLTSLAGQGTAQAGGFLLIGILVTINIFVGLFNLFPLPPLDGGHLAVLGVEETVNGVRRWRGRKPDYKVDPRTVTAIAIPVIALLGIFFVATIVLDITNPLELPQ